MQAKLVERAPKGVKLTVEGSALLSHVHQLRMSLHDVAREIADLGQGRVGHLRVGAHADLVDDLLTLACSALLKEAPKLTVTATVGQ